MDAPPGLSVCARIPGQPNRTSQRGGCTSGPRGRAADTYTNYGRRLGLVVETAFKEVFHLAESGDILVVASLVAFACARAGPVAATGRPS